MLQPLGTSKISKPVFANFWSIVLHSVYNLIHIQLGSQCLFIYIFDWIGNMGLNRYTWRFISFICYLLVRVNSIRMYKAHTCAHSYHTLSVIAAEVAFFLSLFVSCHVLPNGHLKNFFLIVSSINDHLTSFRIYILMHHNLLTSCYCSVHQMIKQSRLIYVLYKF